MASASWIRQIDDLSKVVGGSKHLIDLDADALINAATASTGFSDFGDEEWQPEYYCCVEHLQHYPGLGVLKFLLLKYWLFRHLRNRLLIVNELKQNPGIRQQTLPQPLFIVGMGRTGTSILFELLSLDSRFRAPIGHDANNPVKPPASGLLGKVNHEDMARAINKLTKVLHPGLNQAHEINSDLPTECFHLMGLATINFSFQMGSVKPYTEWQGCQNSHSYYHWHKITLQVLQNQTRKATWLLKCPYHLQYPQYSPISHGLHSQTSAPLSSHYQQSAIDGFLPTNRPSHNNTTLDPRHLTGLTPMEPTLCPHLSPAAEPFCCCCWPAQDSL